MEHTKAGYGQLQILFDLHLNDVTITKLDAGDGHAVLTVNSIAMKD